MKVLIVLLVLLSAGLVLLAPTSRAQSHGNEMAIVEFQDKTQLLNVTLQGKYLFVHDAEKKAEGKECFYVYQYKGDEADPLMVPAGQPVIAFHCEATSRTRASRLVVTIGFAKDGVMELREIQFAGSEQGHRIVDAM
jgi:hypothetical protein